MKTKKTIGKLQNEICGAAGQLAVIVLFAALFFAVACISPLTAAWPADFTGAVRAGLAVSLALLAIFGGAWAVGAWKASEKPETTGKSGTPETTGTPEKSGTPETSGSFGTRRSRYWDRIGMGLMLIVHYLIRVQMVGTLQTDEGLTCYLSLKELSYHPEIIGSSFLEAGKLAGRTAYGYNFFALIGEFVLPGTGYGFEWVQLFGGMAAAACLYGIFRRIFPALKPAAAWAGAFVVSVQPLFLGFSTMCGLEYGITVFFIYAFYCCMNKKYILTAFWLLMLGTTKSTGAIMALTFLGTFLAGTALQYFADRKNGGTAQEAEDEEGPEIDFKSGFIAAAALLALALLAVATVRICRANGIAFSWNYIGIKLAQLFVLNFNWIWTVIVLIGICMVIVNFRVRRTHKMQLVPVTILGGCYLVHLAYLIAYTKAGLPRYNMLTDVLFAMIGTCLLVKMFQRIKAVFPVITLVGLCMLGEAFVTIDPVSAGLFSTMNTNAFPMVFTVYFADDKPEYQGKTGDFAYYNFHYTLLERALNDMIAEFDVPEGDDIVLLSNYEGGETRPEDEVIVWDGAWRRCRFAAFGEDIGERRRVVKVDVSAVLNGRTLPKQAVFFVTPWEMDRTKSSVELLSGYYDVEGPMYAVKGRAGTVEYYFLRLK